MIEVSLYGDRLFIIFVKTSDRFLVKKLKERFRDIFYISVNACVVLNLRDNIYNYGLNLLLLRDFKILF